MSESFEVIADMSNPRERQRVLAAVHALQGVQRVAACEYRPRNTDRMRRWYFPCFCEPFAKVLLDAGNTFPIDPKLAAHRVLKGMFLTQYAADPKTGEARDYVPSIMDLSTREFNDYLDQCAPYLADLRILVPEPNIYHEQPTKKEPKQAATAAGK